MRRGCDATPDSGALDRKHRPTIVGVGWPSGRRSTDQRVMTMNERESDPNGAFRGGSAGLEDESGSGSTGTEYERHAPHGADSGGGRPNTGSMGDGNEGNDGVDADERQTIVEGTAATSAIADPEAQADAERQGDGTPQGR